MFWLVSCALLSSAASLGATQGVPIQLETFETPITTFMEGILPKTVTVSPNGQRLAFGVQKKKGGVIVLDGKEGKNYPFTVMYTLAFSPDSKHFAYAAGTTKEQHLVLDGVDSEASYRGILTMGLSFSPDSKSLAFVATRSDGKMVVVKDGVEGPARDFIEADSLAFSPDSTKLAYVSGKKGHMRVVINEVPDPDFDEVERPVFSAEGGHFAYVARKGKKELLIRDGQVQPYDFDTIFVSIPFLPPAVLEQVKAAIKRNEPVIHTWTLSTRGLVFSPDGSRLAFHASRGKKQYCVVDGVESGPYDGVGASAPIFSPNGKRLADIVMRGNKQIAVVDGVESEYDGIASFTLTFSPDSEHIAYGARIGSQWFLVLDGQRQSLTFDNPIGANTVKFSGDSKHLAYVGGIGEGYQVVLDGVQHKVYKGMDAGIFFSPNGKHLAYSVKRGNKELVVVDGVEGKEYDLVLYGNQFFSSDDTINYITIQASDSVFRRVESKIKD